MTASKKEMKDFSNFVKYLVELGDVYWVDEAWFIMKKINDEPVGMTSNGKALPMVIYHEKLKIGDYVIPDQL